MRHVKQYNSKAERKALLQEFATMYLIEERNITEGNFLVFSDTPPEPPVNKVHVPEAEFRSLQTQVVDANNATLELYEMVLNMHPTTGGTV